MTKEERDRLRGLCAKATPGPWSIERRDNCGIDRVIHGDRGDACHVLEDATGVRYAKATADFIAAANPAATLALLTTLDEYEEENARLREAGTALRTLACHVTGRGTVESCKCGAIVPGPLAKGAGIAHDRQCPVPKWDAMVGRCTCGDDYVAVTATHAVGCAALQGKPGRAVPPTDGGGG